MKEKMDKIDIYNDSAIILSNKTPKRIISWITILVIFLICFIIFSFVPFNIYKPYTGYIYIENGESFFASTLEYSDFPVIKNKKLYVEGKKYKYEIVKLENNNLVLKIDLDNNLKVNKNIIIINVLKERTTIFKILKSKIKKGFGL